ncbi:cation transporter [Patescibacteria group bacterium]|nr:cation transporter [Patescibacteria group bacterium]
MIKTVTIHPSRIGCPSIPGTMKGIVNSVDGVKDVKVRYEERSLDITFDEEKTSEEEIIKTIGQEMGLAMEIAESHGAKKDENVADTCPM